MPCLPQTLAQRAALRVGISDYLLERVNKPWMQELMGALQEVDSDDVRLILREPLDAKLGDPMMRDTKSTALAVAPPQWRWQESWQTRTAQSRWN